MATGTVTWVNASENHGFITPDDGGKDLFVDPSEISGDSRTLVVGSMVYFETRDAPKGRTVAANVVLRTEGTDNVAATAQALLN